MVLKILKIMLILSIPVLTSCSDFPTIDNFRVAAQRFERC